MTKKVENFIALANENARYFQVFAAAAITPLLLLATTIIGASTPWSGLPGVVAVAAGGTRFFARAATPC